MEVWKENANVHWTDNINVDKSKLEKKKNFTSFVYIWDFPFSHFLWFAFIWQIIVCWVHFLWLDRNDDGAPKKMLISTSLLSNTICFQAANPQTVPTPNQNMLTKKKLNWLMHYLNEIQIDKVKRAQRFPHIILLIV